MTTPVWCADGGRTVYSTESEIRRSVPAEPSRVPKPGDLVVWRRRSLLSADYETLAVVAAGTPGSVLLTWSWENLSASRGWEVRIIHRSYCPKRRPRCL